MTRSVPEWIGKNDDSPIPDRVRDRVFDRHNGICHVSGRRIRPGESWDCDHIIAIINGGEHREYNLAPILHGKQHKEKTAEDVAQKAYNYRVRKRHLGIKKPSKFACSRNSRWKKKINGEIVRR